MPYDTLAPSMDVASLLDAVSLEDDPFMQQKNPNHAPSAPASRPSTPEAQIRRPPADPRAVPPPAIRPKWADAPARRRWPNEDDIIDDLEENDDDLVVESFDPETGDVNGFYDGAEWHPIMSDVDICDQAIRYLHADQTMHAFHLGLFDDIAEKVLGVERAKLLPYCVC